jgi:hypothetical protein
MIDGIKLRLIDYDWSWCTMCPGSVGILESYEQALTLSREFGFQ